ncbi:Nuclear cap-binding protein subunit 2 [Pteropus alecto]|uniref:Nuclear cap-binding protein subunit 2 n=1 Tax=Pteropus alecto TaxID=9402 RepID=L5KD95_PTEAL|nr:Nuclear cap-binding protein subunit 2 [Pteropus alecto]
MGLDGVKNTAWSFCFVEYYSRADAENAVRYGNGACLDDPIICTDWDATLRNAGSTSVDGLGARYEMSIFEAAMLGEEQWETGL